MFRILKESGNIAMIFNTKTTFYILLDRPGAMQRATICQRRCSAYIR